jgi:predicted HD superfamily hydrolase involved in NAD metabolism
MKVEEAKKLVKPHLTTARYEHTLRVADTAMQLGNRFAYDGELITIALAAIFHDYAKYRSLDEMRRWIMNSSLPKDLLDYHHELWHGPVGSILIDREYGISDSEIKDAIYYHTTGRANMGNLEMIIFLADYIEPGRNFPGLDQVREMAEQDLIKACWMVSRNNISYLMQKEATIYPDTIHAYNDLTRRNGGNTHDKKL